MSYTELISDLEKKPRNDLKVRIILSEDNEGALKIANELENLAKRLDSLNLSYLWAENLASLIRNEFH